MIFSLDVRRARKGDCLFLHFGTKKAPGLALIDGGPGDVYKPFLRPRLERIRERRKLDHNAPLPLDLVMVSHVDDDHIHGILDLTRDMIAEEAPRLRVLSLWHNSFDDLVDSKDKNVTAQFGTAALNGALSGSVDIDSGEDEEVVRGCLQVLASIDQGQRLRDDARKLDFRLNPEFAESLILAGKRSWEVANGLKFTVAGPMEAEVAALRKKHAQWLKARQKKKPEAALAAYVDESVTNLSSIVVLAESADKRILLTGDARGDKILEGLEKAGVLPKKGSTTVDVLKVPHHGSSNNLEIDFFERIKATHYVFSGDGEHGNPERETIEMLLEARAGEPLEIHLTYPIEEIDKARQADWEKERNKEKKRKARKPRPAWSPKDQSLTAFFEKNKLAKTQKLHEIQGAEPHVIDLHEKLGY